ncbi:LysE family translocator [Paracoccaceae bacterium GXU_MW_L88]
MTREEIIAFALANAAGAWTPGPNNAMLASSGATFGLRRTEPHAIGVGFGFAAMLLVVSLGLGGVIDRSPIFYEVLRWVGAALLIWVAWKIGSSGRGGDVEVDRKPFTFLQAAGFQWINPKAWAMAVGLTGTFASREDPIQSALIMSVIAVLVGLGSAHTWAIFGAGLQRILKNPLHLRLFNLTMAALILVGVYWMVTDH